MEDTVTVPLTRISPLGGGRITALMNSIALVTDPRQWAYSAEVDFDVPEGEDDESWIVKIDVKVESGALGVGLLRDHGAGWLVRDSILEGPPTKDLSLPLPARMRRGKLVFENRTETGCPARALIRTIKIVRDETKSYFRAALAEKYLDLIKRSVSNFIYLGKNEPFGEFRWHDGRYQNYEWSIPRYCQPHSLLSAGKLDLLEKLIVQVERDKVPGDLIEAGIWRGGAVIFMRAVLDAYAIPDRVIYAADSFEGIPYNQQIKGDFVDIWKDRWIANFDEVVGNIARYNLLDDRIKFIRGYFNVSLPEAKLDRLALVRLDANSYHSTMDALIHLYPKLSSGGAIIIDDWHLPGCRLAVKQFRKARNITTPVVIDAANKYWVKE